MFACGAVRDLRKRIYGRKAWSVAARTAAQLTEGIARIRDPRERAKALLRLKRPPVTDVHYLQLVYSVEFCCDRSGVSVALRTLKLLQKRDHSEFGDALSDTISSKSVKV